MKAVLKAFYHGICMTMTAFGTWKVGSPVVVEVAFCWNRLLYASTEAVVLKAARVPVLVPVLVLVLASTRTGTGTSVLVLMYFVLAEWLFLHFLVQASSS
jgi:hypothetical protein